MGKYGCVIVSSYSQNIYAEVDSQSAIKAAHYFARKDHKEITTVFRKKTHEILSRIQYDKNLQQYSQLSHPMYLEEWIEMGKMTDKEREVYCRDCDRSIWGKYHDCDINIENDGKYVMTDDKCYCKIVNGQPAHKYPWEEE